MLFGSFGCGDLFLTFLVMVILEEFGLVASMSLFMVLIGLLIGFMLVCQAGYF